MEIWVQCHPFEGALDEFKVGTGGVGIGVQCHPFEGASDGVLPIGSTLFR